MSAESILKEAEEAFSFFQTPKTSANRGRNMLSTSKLEVALRSLGLRPPTVRLQLRICVATTTCASLARVIYFLCVCAWQARDWDEFAEVREQQSARFQYLNDQHKGDVDWGDFRFIVEHRLKHRDTPADLLQAFKVRDTVNTRSFIDRGHFTETFALCCYGVATFCFPFFRCSTLKTPAVCPRPR